MTRVVVTGIGVVSPAGVGVAPLWDIAVNGRSLQKDLRSLDDRTMVNEFEFAADAICELADLTDDLEKLPEEIRRQDRFVQFAALAALEALSDARLSPELLQGPRTALALATAICGTPTMEREFLRLTTRGTGPLNPSIASNDLYLAALSNTPAILLSSLLGIQGPAFTLSTGCVGGIDAVGAAYEMITDGEVDVVIAGASEAPISSTTVAAFEIIGCLSTEFQDAPSTASRPFDAGRNGFVLSEGAGFLVLENAEHAAERGVHPYMEISGFALSANAMHMTSLAAEGGDLARAMELALVRAAVEPASIDHVNAHGSSTIQNDRCETSAIKKTLGDHAYEVPVTSLKSMIGHPLAAASAIELAICAKSFQEKYLPPTANYVTPDPECDLNYLPNWGANWAGIHILKQANGFGGLHAAVVMRAIDRESISDV